MPHEPKPRLGRAKITSAEARSIKETLARSLLTLQQVADKHNTTYRIVWSIANNITWKHIK